MTRTVTDDARTAGERIFTGYRLTGARGEAASGFTTVHLLAVTWFLAQFPPTLRVWDA